MNKLLVILGPTATGKTDIAIDLSKKLMGEIVAADSRQVYRGLDLGTGKLPGKEVKFERGDGFWIVDGVKIYMYDVVIPTLRYHVAQYIRDANEVIKKIVKEKKLPIIVGGTGLYIKGLINGFSSLSIPEDSKLRKDLEKLEVEELVEKLIALSPTTYNKLNSSDKKNPRRIIRKIELLSNTKNQKNIIDTPLLEKFNILKIGLTAPREILNKRIDQRVEKRITQGMIVEARNILKTGIEISRMKEFGLEYGMLALYLEGKLSKEEFKEILKIKIHQYAKRQMTYFNTDETISWFDITEKDYQKKVENLVLDWYNKPD